MHTLVILAHPYAKSYCHALYERVILTLEQAGRTVDRLHLDGESFDPVMRSADLAVYAMGESADPAVMAYQARIDAAQQLVFIFPIWWEVMPALLKGFLDKVFTKGWAYEPAKLGVKGHLDHIQRADHRHHDEHAEVGLPLVVRRRRAASARTRHPAQVWCPKGGVGGTVTGEPRHGCQTQGMVEPGGSDVCRVAGIRQADYLAGQRWASGTSSAMGPVLRRQKCRQRVVNG